MREDQERTSPGGSDSGTEDRLPRLRRLLDENREELTGFVRRKAYRSLLLLEPAEDLAQGICLHALDHVGSYPGVEGEAFRGWLFSLAQNYLVDRRRYWSALKRSGADVLRYDDGLAGDLAQIREMAASVTGPSTFASRREQLTLASQALSVLFERDRELIDGLCNGVPLESAAQRFGITYEAAQRARLRAVDRLKKAFRLLRERSGRPR